jgi:mycothiol system anti-sigma-R factor
MTPEGRLIPCSEAVERLWEYLDRTLTPEDQARVEQHLAFCRRCCGELEFARELRAFLATAAADEIPPDVRERLKGFVRELGG